MKVRKNPPPVFTASALRIATSPDSGIPPRRLLEAFWAIQKTFLDTHCPESALTPKGAKYKGKENKTVTNKFERKFIHTSVKKTFSTIALGRIFIFVSDFEINQEYAYKNSLYIKINDGVACLLNKPGEYQVPNSDTEVYPVLNSIS